MGEWPIVRASLYSLSYPGYIHHCTPRAYPPPRTYPPLYTPCIPTTRVYTTIVHPGIPTRVYTHHCTPWDTHHPGIYPPLYTSGYTTPGIYHRCTPQGIPPRVYTTVVHFKVGIPVYMPPSLLRWDIPVYMPPYLPIYTPGIHPRVYLPIYTLGIHHLGYEAHIGLSALRASQDLAHSACFSLFSLRLLPF